MKMDINVRLCEGVAEYLRRRRDVLSDCEVRVDYAPNIDPQTIGSALLVVCPSSEEAAETSRDGVDVREIELQIGFFRQASVSDVPALLATSGAVARLLEFSKDLNLDGVTPYTAERDVLYDPKMLLEKGVFFSLIRYHLKVSGTC